MLVLTILGSLGVFLFGMKIMSEALQKIAGDRIRNILSRITSRPINGVITGALVTSLIQSSSATTVMTVSFANAGLLSLAGSIAVIMGANIGTTITAWIISIFGLKFSVAVLSLPMIAFSLPFIFAKKDRAKSIGEFLIGFALLFMGLDMLKNSIPDIGAHPDVLEFIGTFSNFGYGSVILFVMIGTICTIIMQSSSAMMAITLVMCSQGWIGYCEAAAIVLGENIGTTITANIAASVANTTARRVARSHFVFNTIGVIWVLIIFYPYTKIIASLTVLLEGSSPFVSQAVIPVSLSLFHTLFNIVNTSILIWFIPQIEKLVGFMVKDEEDKKTPSKLTYMSSGLLNTSELNIESARREIKIFSERIITMFDNLGKMNTTSGNDFENAKNLISKYENITDRMEIEITDFLGKTSDGNISSETSQQILSMLRIINNLERLGDGIYKLSKIETSRRNQNIEFTDNEKINIEHMYNLVDRALLNMDYNLATTTMHTDISKAYTIEEEINACRDRLHDDYIKMIENEEVDFTVCSFYLDTFTLYEKLGDYIINVNEGLDNSRKVAYHKSN